MSDYHALPLYLRFWPKVDASGGPNACWEWTAGRSPFGYGKIRTGPAGDPEGLAHRISWEMFKGPIPPGLMVLHVCDNPDVDAIRRLYLKGMLQREIAARYGINQPHVSRIVLNQSWAQR